MLDELILLLPSGTSSAALVVSVLGSLVGVALWVFGARFSRPVLTLSAVTIGGVVGLEMPRWFGWNVSGAGPAVGAAVVFGVSAYVLHRLWVGLTLGLVLCLWAFFASWILLKNSQSIRWPDVKGGDLLRVIGDLWQSLPVDMIRILPYVSGVAVVFGLAMAILWDRFTLLLTWSLAGVTLSMIAGALVIERARPSLLGVVPKQTWAQVLCVIGVVGLGMLIQTRSTPRRAAAPAGKPPKPDKPSKPGKG